MSTTDILHFNVLVQRRNIYIINALQVCIFRTFWEITPSQMPYRCVSFQSTYWCKQLKIRNGSLYRDHWWGHHIQIHFNSLQIIWYQLPTDSTCFSKWFAETAWFAQNQTWLFKSWLESRCWEKSETLNPNPISWTRVRDVFVFYQNVVICKFDQNKRSRNFTFVPVYIPWIIW